MRIQDKHLHAISVYSPTSLKHFYVLFLSILFCKLKGLKSVTNHLPFEVEHPAEFNTFSKMLAKTYIFYGQFLKQLFAVKLYWENSPVLNVGSWDLKYGQTDWQKVPGFLELTLDTGHLILGSRNKKEARDRLEFVLKIKGKQIKHLHLHENDLKTDLHLKWTKINKDKRIIDQKLFKSLTRGRSYIFEDPS